MRVTFLGNAAWSVPSLEHLASSAHDVALVLTRVPRRAGRRGQLTPTAVALAARVLGIALAEVESVRSGPGFDALAASRPDVLAVVAYGEILPPEVLALPAVAPINVHFSLLPELRGAAPVQRAILEGRSVTGVTTIRMDEGMDTGPILLQTSTQIDDGDDAGSLGTRLAALGASLFVDTLDALATGRLTKRPQDHERATYAPKVRAEEEIIDWSESATKVVRRVRALAPEPGARTAFRGRILKVVRASPLEDRSVRVIPKSERFPGAVAARSNDGLVVWAGAGAVALDEVQPEGRKRMTGGEFVRGYRPEVSERLR